MTFALSSGVTGLQAHQKMLDVAGNNLANVNTTAFKASRITFSELLSETIQKASQPTSVTGGTNPQQIGSGVGVKSISPNTTQGNIVSTGNPWDMAIEGEGYFVLRDGKLPSWDHNVYTRAGTFAVDADNKLVDPATGYWVERIGPVGEADGFQTVGDSSITIPFDVALAARGTSQVVIAGNLSADGTFTTPQTNMMNSNITFSESSGGNALGSTLLSDLTQYTSGTLDSATISVSGYDHDGNILVDSSPLVVDATTLVSLDMNGLINHINTVLTGTATASLVNGRIRITDSNSGYSRSDVQLTFANSGTADLAMPSYFEIATVGGEEVKNIDITVYDSIGGAHTLSGAFVRTNTANTWDMVLTSITGDVSSMSFDGRRIEGITFDANNGSYLGLSGSDQAQFEMAFDYNPSSPQTITISLGMPGQFDGLTQFAGDSTAVAREQDGYTSGNLSSVSANSNGVLIGTFSNGVRKDIATMQIATFQNPSGLESVGNGYFIPSANSGEPIGLLALTGGAGSIHGGALEKSNADVATEFVNMIQAQNGYQANARTITVANDILRELTNLIR
jgi:flagellar hook protein FlgE